MLLSQSLLFSCLRNECSHPPYFSMNSLEWLFLVSEWLEGFGVVLVWMGFLFRPYLANRCPDRSHSFCAGKPLFTPFFGLPELAERSTIGCVSPNSAWHSQNPHISSVLSEIFIAFYGLWLVLKQRLTRFWEALIRVKRTGGSCVTTPSPSGKTPTPHFP